ncbi:MAG: class I SAM-dependent RNA methyltransferase [Actinomycetota bacterium]|nr:class I SAM-dependent RNA methyltransferase [Actinomycetota bacterium]
MNKISNKNNRYEILDLTGGVPIYGGRVLVRKPPEFTEAEAPPSNSTGDRPRPPRSKVIMVKGAIPGETVGAVIDEERRDYSLATTVNVLEPSPERVEPPCPHFGTCGGCRLQYASHAKQIEMKEAVLADNLRRIGKIEVGLDEALVLDDGAWGYRYRAQFKVDAPSIGFFKEKSNEVVDIERCPLLVDELNQGLARIRAALASEPDIFAAISEIHATYGDGVFALVRLRPGKQNNNHLNDIGKLLIKNGFDGVVVKGNSTSATHGKDSLTLPLNDIDYTISPGGFIQGNWRLNQVMVARILSQLGSLSGRWVLDLYAGAGNFALPVAQSGAEVIAVEESKRAVTDGWRNLERNSLANVRIVRSVLEAFDMRTAGHIDITIVDPPRSGIGGKVIDNLLGLQPETIVYVSCDPATLARDLKWLAPGYKIDSVRLVDFFPQTFHIESLAFLTRAGV